MLQIDGESNLLQQDPFVHPWIAYNPKSKEIIFSDDAKVELGKRVHSIQDEMKKVTIQYQEDLTGLVSIEIWQAVVDAMIAEWKWKQKVNKFLKQFSKVIAKPETLNEKQEHKVNKKLEKFGHDPYVHLYIKLNEDKEILPVPFIVRPSYTLDEIIKSLKNRLKLPTFKKS